MAKEGKAINLRPPVNPERKWIRLQTFGLAQLVSIPFVPLLTLITTGGALRIAESTMALPLIVILILAGSGFACLDIGEDKRRAIRANKRE